MNKFISFLAAAVLLAGCSKSEEPRELAVAEPALNSGIDREGMNPDVRPQDDFFTYANGRWVDSTEIPADQSGWGSFNILADNGLSQLQAIVEDAMDSSEDAKAAKIGNYYRAWMNEDRVNELGISPVSDLLGEIDALESHDQVVEFFATNNELGIDGPVNFFIGQDDKNPDTYILTTDQSGLGLPDRDYYFDETERGIELRSKYVAFIGDLLSLSGYNDAAAAAERIMAVETQVAGHHWDKVDNRDAVKTYNIVTGEEFAGMLAEFDATIFLNGVGTGEQDKILVRQPSFIEGFGELFITVPVDTWKEYLRVQVVNSFANFLAKDFVDANFDFFGKTLQGRQEQRPRWKRAINSTNGNLGELLGQVYVEKHFPAEAKTRMLTMVQNLVLAYEESIKNLDWMSDETKTKALDKLSKFTPMIGYPDKWRDYSELEISANELVGNVRRARTFEHYRNVDKLGAPVDRAEWFMPPQQVNAYYNPPMNQIVFPAAILQPPFFIFDAEDARNYGAIGLVIGHEIGHGFDDQGSKYDGDGNLRNWWTDADRAGFEERTSALVDQYNQFEPLPGLFVNGELTLGENIGDLGGAAIALRAYEMSLGDEESPIIDDLTGRERFFLGYAQVWRSKYRDEVVELRVKSDPHSPAYFRVNGVVPNIDEFYDTFDVNEGDAHYRPPEERVYIWR
jgi:putative endopeptidase